jgi:hypothetical protein
MATNEQTVHPWGEHISINPADIAAGPYLTFSQAIGRIMDRLYFNAAQSRMLVGIGRSSGFLPHAYWNPMRESPPDLPWWDRPPLDVEYWQTATVDPSDPDGLLEPVCDYQVDGTSVIVRRDDECRYRKPLFLREWLDKYLDDFEATGFSPATESDIRRALDEVYDSAAANGLPPPDVLKTAMAAKANLSGALIKASQNQIRPIVREDSYRQRRAKPGPKGPRDRRN